MLMTKQKGFTLTEMMISTAIGLIVSVGLTNILVSSVKGNSDYLRASMLNQELNTLLHLVAADVKRAGFWAAVPGVDDLSVNPFMSFQNDLLVAERIGEDDDSCIVYSYDLDKDKSVDVGDSATAAPFNAAPYDTGGMEHFGFRVSGSSVQMRTGLASESETLFDCDSGAWTNVTDQNTEITDLTFIKTTQYLNVTTDAVCSPATTNCCASGEACQLIRDVEINISGRLAQDHNVLKTVTALTRIRNDKFIVMP